MHKPTCLLLFALLVFPLVLQAQSDLPKYRLIILDFKLDSQVESIRHLERDLPEALEPVVGTCPNIVTLEREQHARILEEIEYQYERSPLFDESTRAKLKRQVGANVALVGKIKPRADEIRIDVKIVVIETGVRVFEAYRVDGVDNLRTQRQIAKRMEELGQEVCEILEGKPIWPLYMLGGTAVASLGIGSYAYLQGRSSYENFLKAKNRDEMEHYKDKTEEYRKVVIISAISIGVSAGVFFFYRSQYKNSLKFKNLNLNIRWLNNDTLGMNINVKF